MQPNLRSSFLSTSSKYRRMNQKQLTDFLINSFEFSPELASLIIAIHQCSDMPELMSLFVLDDNNRYPHVFIPNSPNPATAICRVCQQSQAHHVHEVTWEELTSFQQQIKQNPKLLEQEYRHSYDGDSDELYEESPNYMHNYSDLNEHIEYKPQSILPKFGMNNVINELKTCSICYGTFEDEQLAAINGVTHEICVTCMSEYLKEQILNLRIQKLACPHCTVELSADTIKQYVSNTIFQKYQTFARNIEIQKNPNLKWCPNPKCSVVISISKGKSTIKCPKCSTLVCAKCNQEAHPKMSCDEAIRSVFKDLENASDIQKCKKCKALVEKVAGCNHMTCRVCKYEWCWLCGSTYSDIHFSPLNPLGCAGMQNRNISAMGKCRIYTLRVLMVLGFLVLLPIVIPLVMIFCGPVLLYHFLARNVCKYCNCFVYILIAIMCLPIGLAIDPFVWIGSTIYFMPLICEAIKNWFQRRRNIIQGSENQIKRKLLYQGEAVVVEE